MQLVLDVLVGPRSFVNPARDSRLWLFLVVAATSGITLPALVGVAAYLRATRDALTVRTVVFALLASPIAVWVTKTAISPGQGRSGAYGTLWYPLALALLIGVVRAGVVAAARRRASRPLPPTIG